MPDVLPRERESLHVGVKRDSAGVWNWSVTDTERKPPQLLAIGAAPSRAGAWADAASVVNDQGESDA